MSKDQIGMLADYIMANCPFEIGDEGAGDVAIRVMGRMASGIERALTELEREPTPHTITNAEEILKEAFGQWGALE